MTSKLVNPDGTRDITCKPIDPLRVVYDVAKVGRWLARLGAELI